MKGCPRLAKLHVMSYNVSTSRVPLMERPEGGAPAAGISDAALVAVVDHCAALRDLAVSGELAC